MKNIKTGEVFMSVLAILIGIYFRLDRKQFIDRAAQNCLFIIRISSILKFVYYLYF